MIGTTIREFIQHRGFGLGFGSALDLFFFFIGGVIGVEVVNHLGV